MMKSALLAGAFAFVVSEAVAQETQPPSPAAMYAGFWHLHSSRGFSGNLSLDGLGGCSYFLSTAFTTLQATCVMRVMPNGDVMIFGTQEGTSLSGPAYGDQLTVPSRSAVPTTMNMIIHQISSMRMKGYLVAGGRKEAITLRRE